MNITFTVVFIWNYQKRSSAQEYLCYAHTYKYAIWEFNTVGPEGASRGLTSVNKQKLQLEMAYPFIFRITSVLLHKFE